jgi:hypothetical protein
MGFGFEGAAPTNTSGFATIAYVDIQDAKRIAKDDGLTYDTNAIKTVTAAEYAAILVKDPSTIYFIV